MDGDGAEKWEKCGDGLPSPSHFLSACRHLLDKKSAATPSKKYSQAQPVSRCFRFAHPNSVIVNSEMGNT